MGTRQLCRLTALFAVTACVVPAAADAAMRKATGETSQGRGALVWVRDDNSVALVKVQWRAACRRSVPATGSLYFRDNQRQPFVRDGARFSDGGKTTDRLSGGTKAPRSPLHVIGGTGSRAPPAQRGEGGERASPEAPRPRPAALGPATGLRQPCGPGRLREVLVRGESRRSAWCSSARPRPRSTFAGLVMRFLHRLAPRHPRRAAAPLARRAT